MFIFKPVFPISSFTFIKRLFSSSLLSTTGVVLSAYLRLLRYVKSWAPYCKIHKKFGIPDHFTCLLRNLYAGQEATVRTWHGTIDWFQIGEGLCQGYILPLCLFNLYAEYIMWNARLDETQVELQIAGKNINNLRYADDTTLMAESEEELRALDEGERGEWKAGLKLNIQKNWYHGIQSYHFMANRWGNNGNSGRLYFLGLQYYCGQWLQPWN